VKDVHSQLQTAMGNILELQQEIGYHVGVFDVELDFVNGESTFVNSSN